MWDGIERAANIIQIISFIPFLIAAWLLFTRANRYKRKIKEQEEVKSEKPMALAISLAGIDIKPQVEGFLKSKGLSMPVESYYKKDGVTKENIGKLLNDILEVKRKMTEDQVTEVHLFLACPVAFSAAVGAILDNWVPVKVYTLDRNTGTYEFWTVLHKGFIPGLRYEGIDDVVAEEVKPDI